MAFTWKKTILTWQFFDDSYSLLNPIGSKIMWQKIHIKTKTFVQSFFIGNQSTPQIQSYPFCRRK